MDLARITVVRHELLTLHRVLIEAARIDLERVEGRLTANQMLDRLMTDELLAWLRPLTTFIVVLDEALEREDPVDHAPLVTRAIELLAFEPGSEYARLLHERPEVTLAHAAAMRVLRSSR